MKYQFEQISLLGNRKVNEDFLGVAETSEAILMVVADGMGGYKGGQVASKALVNFMLKYFKATKFPVDNPQSYLKTLVADAHLAVITAGSKNNPPLEPRTTCVVCLIQDGLAWWVHVGDSRLYMFRNERLFKRTVDHSKIEELHRKGKITKKEMENHPLRNLVTRCVGFQQHPPVPSVSDEVQLARYDMIVLCSDGLWGPLNNEIIIETLKENSIIEAVEGMAEKAESKSYPESDNISLIVFRWVSNDSDEKLVEPNEESTSDYAEDELTRKLDKMDKMINKKLS